MRPTALGLKGLAFAGLLIASYFATPYSNLFFLLLAQLVCLGVLAVAATRRNLRGVSGRVRELPAQPAGEPALLEVEIDTGERTCDGLEIQVRGGGLPPLHETTESVKGPAVLHLRTPPMARGVYPMGEVRIGSTWPMGVVFAGVRAETPAELVVHPGVGSQDPSAPGGGPDGLVSSTEMGRGQPAGLRDYREGDELRSVDARASARRGTQVVAEWDEDRGDGVHVLLDRRVPAERLEEELRVLTALAYHSREREEGFSLSSQGLCADFGGAGGRPWSELWRWLAEVQVAASGEEPTPAPAGATRLGRGKISAHAEDPAGTVRPREARA